MRQLLQRIGNELQAFVRQRDDVAMILSSPSADALPILTLVDGVEANSASDMFWTFTDNFTDPAAYVDAVVGGFAAKHQGVRLALEKEGMTPWPAIPAFIMSPETSPAGRLRGLAAFSRELLPIPGGGNIVWVLYPLDIADARLYAHLMAQLLRHEFPNPWCHHLRFIIRDDPVTPMLRHAFAGAPRVRWFQPDLGPEAVQRALEEAAEDEALPLDERVTNLMVLAGVDHANHRYPDALAKFELLLGYHAPLGNYVMAAASLNGMGEAYQRMGDLERAADSYQAALVPASQGEQPAIPVLLNIVLNLASVRFSQERWAEAEGYYDLAQQLAIVARNGPARVQALDFRGLCQHRQRKLRDAEQSWYSGSVIAAQLEDVELCRTLVARLQQYYAETGQHELERERREQLAALSA
jgi:tetratricopeptide (TPR) repeat protein